MPNICEFDLVVKGQSAQLENFVTSVIQPAIVEGESEFILRTELLGVDLTEEAESQHVALLRLRDYRAERVESPFFHTEFREWYAFQTPLSMSEIARVNREFSLEDAKRVQREQVALNDCKFDASDPIAQQAVSRALGYDAQQVSVPRYRNLLDQPMPRMRILGESAWSLPAFISPLSRAWPNLVFEILGVTEHFQYEKWVITKGMAHCHFHMIENIQTDEIIWYVKDGLTVAEPGWERLEETK